MFLFRSDADIASSASTHTDVLCVRAIEAKVHAEPHSFSGNDFETDRRCG